MSCKDKYIGDLPLRASPLGTDLIIVDDGTTTYRASLSTIAAAPAVGGGITGGTPGSVLFVGAGSTIAQDNANFFYDDSQNFLGIGTNAPNATLEVVCSAFGEARFRNQTATTYTSFRFLNDLNSDFYSVIFGLTGSTSTGLLSGGSTGQVGFLCTTTTDPLTLGTNGTQTVTIGGNDQFVAIGNRKTPSARLDVSGNAVIGATTNLGSEKVTNGTFTGSATGWTLGTGWAYNANTADKNSNGVGTLSQNVSAVVGEIYLLTFTVTGSNLAGLFATVGVTCGGVTLPAIYKNEGHSFVFRATSTADLVFTPSNGSTRFVIDNVSLKRVSDGNLLVGGATYLSGSTTSRASLNVASGVAPTSPINGDVWYDGTHMYGRVNGSTVQLDNGAAVDFAVYPVACSDETTALTIGTKITFRMPRAMTLTAVRASVGTAPTGSTVIVDINENGTTILSTKLSIDATEKTSTTAVTPAVISDVNLADDAEITIDIDQIGSTIAGAGLKVYLIGTWV